MDPEQGQKVVEGVPVSSYYGTFQGQGSYPPQQYGQQQQSYPPQQYGQQQQSYPPQQYGQQQQSYPPVNTGRIPYPAISDSQDRYHNYGRPAWGAQQYAGSNRLPFCNLGYGWLLFILGFLFVVPWYIGAIMLFCLSRDSRERGGLIACTIAAIVVLLAGGSGHMYHRRR